METQVKRNQKNNFIIKLITNIINYKMDIDEVCTKLKETYDANILTDADVYIKSLFIHYALENKDNKKGNRTLIKLINNYYDSQNKNIKYISGPDSLTLQVHPVTNTTVYTFGEFHGTKSTCTLKKYDGEESINKFLLDLTKNTAAFLDIFIETDPLNDIGEYLPYYEGGRFEKQKLFQLTGDFIECIETKKRKDNPECELFRFHWTDVRFVPGGRGSTRQSNEVEYSLIENAAIDDFSKFMLYLEMLSRSYLDLAIIRKIGKNRIYKKLLNILKNPSSYKQLLHTFEEGMLSNKEINRSNEFHKICDTLLPLMKEDLKRLEKSPASHIARDLQNLKIEKVKHAYQLMSDYAEQLFRQLIHINSYTMDFYLLSRMFKTFKVGDKDAPRKPHNIICYAGETHSNRIRYVLKEMGYINLFDQTYGDEQIKTKQYLYKIPEGCVDIEEMPQPIF